MSFDEQERIRKIFVDHFRKSGSAKPKRKNETEIRTSEASHPASGPDPRVLATLPIIKPELAPASEGETPPRWDMILFLSYNSQTSRGSCCSTVVEHMTRDRKIVGSNPAGCWASSFLYLISGVSLIRSNMEVQHY